MVEKAAEHKNANAQFLLDATAAQEVVDGLEDKIVADAASTLSTKVQELGVFTQATAAGVQAVEDARARLTKLIDAKTTQDEEVAALGERESAADQAYEDAKTAEKAADLAKRVRMQQVEDVAAQVAVPLDEATGDEVYEQDALKERSYLFQVLKDIDPARWEANCTISTCVWTETDKGADKSVWTWPNSCNVGNATCDVLGLRNLIAETDKALGTNRDNWATEAAK